MPMKDSLLWELIHPATKVKHYLFGTMHVKNEAAFAHTDAAIKYLVKCGKYAGEMDLNDVDLPTIQDYFQLPSVLSLQDLIGERRFTRYRKIIKKAFKVDIKDYTHLKPMILTNMVAEQLLTASYETSLDQYLWDEAERAGKEMHGLESVAHQIKILQAIPMDIQVKMLKSLTRNVSRYRKKVFKVSKLYQEGRVHQLYQTTKKSLGKLRKPLLYTRNHLMADRIVELSAAEPLFVAVGAAHLGGKNGVLRLMKKSGYKVKPLSTN